MTGKHVSRSLGARIAYWLGTGFAWAAYIILATGLLLFVGTLLFVKSVS